MNRLLFFVMFFFLLLQSPVFSASFPHKTAIYERITKGPMVDITEQVYTRFPKDMNDINAYLEAEWRVQKTFVGTERTLHLSKQGINYSVNLDTQVCTKQDMRKVSEEFLKGADPQKFGDAMRKEMGFDKPTGTCTVAGLKGKEYTSSQMGGRACFYEGFFNLSFEMMGTKTWVSKVQFDKRLPKDKISLPKNVHCKEAPSLQDALGGMKGSAGSHTESITESGTASERKKQRSSPPNMEDAMKKMKDALGNFEKMFPKQGK